jgi:(p)ppGpp synthase/HD superfamily hydrolase
MKKGELLNKMITLAANAHADQYDRGGNPYILHCMKVMHYVKSDVEELQCIALGHDLIEDTYVSVNTLKDLGFTDRIVNGIIAMTKQQGQSYDDYKQQVKMNDDAIIVKMDYLRNNSDIRRLKNKSVTEKDIARMVKYHNFILNYRICLIMTELDIDKKLEEIAFKHLGIETLVERRMDSLDFHDVSVMGLKCALTAAYAAGYYASINGNF